MEKIRAFIALEMPEPIRTSLADLCERMKSELSDVPLRWVPIPNMHLTLKFLGDVKPDQVEKIIHVINSQCSKYSPFDISLNELGAFPHPQRARVLWVGVDSLPSLNKLVDAFEMDLAGLGFLRESRPYSPHLTLARVRGHARPADLHRINEVINSSPNPRSASAVANKIVLFRSELKPSGSVYNALSEFVLT